ncbi:hypothetical protein EDC18_10149 [Natranaerovirga pectinivora]|uniref:Uncharacterized protein n=1 Tax=Natranaerovirga pectinivora TaxID=682400 RepID=A0A4R3MPP8_9FIRM|nr:hypothetical protein [Natranaerovirga pectinivora]TCT16754.1 hypothetical protein EDC18_10149 [Natranaerovirga pectinivora]
MRASFDDYSFVAHLCSSYKPDNPNGAFTASVGDRISCLNCVNLDERDGRCKLDLYDRIMDNNEE